MRIICVGIRCVVACRDASGKPTFFTCRINCTQEEYCSGLHYDTAEETAEDLGYETSDVVFDENDGPAWLFEHFDWGSAIVVDCLPCS